ncbi:DUF2326 domain-containing protein [Vreelandella boliviensis]|uniref:DUF2326 domain-containing protein n=1 Tax=Vreelandella boliviensis LC1 TaxID=1072583 RepID=A0A265DVF7_9GAMM|nr:DUF2326 domain-containing protein [Halomonas boliviensis]EHJ92693.1 hypothetical protein KUC_2650 [Halomonas boliviensis LC1]OZT73312.1 DUF2326 domain-containing protein [Halomonas boliviensis LC1]
MILSKLYTDKGSFFEPIFFKDGLNVIYGEIRLPENRDKDTHNLGKSTLGRVIDFSLLSKKDPRSFLFKHEKIFSGFTFFIEIKLKKGSYLTVKRSVAQASKVSFKKHNNHYQDFSFLGDEGWDHINVPFDRAKDLLDSLLNLSYIKPWTFRNALGYLIRSQDDYNDVFKLRKFGSRDAHWKPYLAHILGFNAELISEHYKKEEELSKKEVDESTIRKELGGSVEDISKIEGILLIKQKDADKKQNLLDAFDFREQDKETTKNLVDGIDERIAELNKKRYSLKQERKKILKSLEEDKINFRTSDAEKIFEDVGILFPNQLKKDFDQLISFNKAITEERISYLLIEKDELESEIVQINSELNRLGQQRSESLSFLSDTEIFNKYKALSNQLIILRTDIETLERQKKQVHRLQELRGEIRKLSEKCSQLQSQIEENTEEQNSDKDSIFSQIRFHFSEIVDDVINRKALLSASPNSKGHLQFKAEILDESGNATSADMGHTYRKLLCIAFDLAVLRAHLNDTFPRFVFHDGIFESLDSRKKENLLSVARQYSDMGVQSIITVIDSDLPKREEEDLPVFDESEIILQLHDENESGRLFKMKAW